MRTTPRKRLGDLLIEDGVLTPDQLEQVLEARIQVSGRLERLGETALRLGLCTADDLGRVLATQMGLPYLGNQVLSVDPLLAARVPAGVAERHNVVPLRRNGDVVTVACLDPTDVVGLDDVRVAVGTHKLDIVVAPSFAIAQAIRDHIGTESTPTEGIIQAYATVEEELSEDEAIVAAQDGPIVRLVDDIIATASRQGASDIHIEPKLDKCLVRYRVDGVLHESLSLPRTVSRALTSRVKLIASLDIAEKRKPQDGRCHFPGTAGRPHEAVDLRVSTLPTMFGETIVMRLLRRDSARLDLSSSGMDQAQARQVLAAVERPQGLVLVTGPTGSGKTSTLYTLLDHLAIPDRKLITVEDPIEYELPGIVQTQVNRKAGYNMATALRAILRQDPDVVLVGEIRDPETAEIALQASLTGHLVLSSLHTNDAASAVVRLTELGVPSYLVASALSMVVAQRLARRVCDSCAVPVSMTERQRLRLGVRVADGAYRDGTGCPVCHNTGYRGRVGLFEVLPIDTEIREMISRGDSSASIAASARRAGSGSLRDDGLAKAAAAHTTLDEVLRATPDPDLDRDLCRTCGKRVESHFTTCPWCATDLRPYRCAGCDASMDPAWIACPTCATPAATLQEGDGSLPHILVVDDDANVRAAITAMLMGDFEVTEAATGEDALAAIHTLQLDAVLLDKGLPDVDGYVVAREIRSRPSAAHLPVMVLTGQDDPAVEIEGMKAGIDDWIAKPVDMNVLIARLTRLTDRSRTRT